MTADAAYLAACRFFGHVNSTGFDPERCVYCGEPVTADARLVLTAAGRLRCGDTWGALRLLQGHP